MSARLRIPVHDERGGPLAGVRVVLFPRIIGFMEWWTGQYVRFTSYGRGYYIVVNSEWNADTINANPYKWPPPYALIIEVWGDTIPTPTPPDFNVVPTDGKVRYERGDPPSQVQDMRATDGHWRVDRNLHFWTFPRY